MTETIASKFQTLEATLNTEILERRTEIWGHLVALVGGATCFTIGPPGIAKTMLPLRLSRYITGGEFFDITVNSFTQPEEFFGPQSIKALKEDRFERMIDGTLATAQWGMIDEVFKAYKVLTSLHRLLNEGTYKHGTHTQPAPLTTLFCMSNEMPRTEELEALYDRLLLRFAVGPIKDPRNLMAILDPKLQEHPEPILTWAEVALAQDAAHAVVLPTEVLEATVEIWRELRANQIEPSDRRLARAMKLVKAAAWLDECQAADVEHLRVLEHVLWHHPSQAADVSRIVIKIASPLDNEVLDLLATIEEVEQGFATARALTDKDDRLRAGNEIESKIRRTVEAQRKLRHRVGENKGRNLRLDEVSARLRPLVEGLLVEFFEFHSQKAADVANKTVEDAA